MTKTSYFKFYGKSDRHKLWTIQSNLVQGLSTLAKFECTCSTKGSTTSCSLSVCVNPLRLCHTNCKSTAWSMDIRRTCNAQMKNALIITWAKSIAYLLLVNKAEFSNIMNSIEYLTLIRFGHLWHYPYSTNECIFYF